MALNQRVVVVGLGSIGKRHYRLLSERKDIVVEAIEPNEVVAAAAVKELGEVVLHKNFKTALATKPDIVWLATPTVLHMQQSIDALQAGCHVFCEKPMANNATEAKKIMAAVKQAGKHFSVGYYLRYWKGMTTIKNMMAEGLLGNVLHAYSRVGTYITLVNSISKYQATTPGSIFLDYAHQPDIFHWLFQKKPASVFVSSLQGGNLQCSSLPNVADIMLRYHNTDSFAATIHLNYVQMPQRHEYEIVGDKAWIILDAETQTIKIGYRDSCRTESISILQERDDIFRVEHQAFFNAINLQELNLNEVESAVTTQVICDAIIEAWSSGEIVRLAY